MAGLTYLMLAHDWEKRTFGEGPTLYEEGVTIEVSIGMGGRVILAGKYQREKKNIVAQIIENYIIGSKQMFY